MKFKYVLILTVILNVCSLAGVIVKKPAAKYSTSFAIIIDKTTYEKIGGAVDAYKKSVEEDGLSTYILINDWSGPDEIKEEILKLYKQQPPLEGIVLIGDIPIPMVRNAQHMTSAFKLDEEAFPFQRSSVPTDRFYDDFDLKFNFIKRDTSQKLFYYYSLAPESPQRIEKDIYSARIKPSVTDDSKYQIIEKYLRRVVEEKKERNYLDNALVFTGQGYNSEALTAWADENLALREQFPYLYKPGGKLKKLNHSMSEQMKEIIVTELEKGPHDIAIFHAHGDDDRQYLIDYETPSNPEGQIEMVKLYLRSKLRAAARRKKSVTEAKNYFMKELDVPEDWFKGAFDDSVKKADSLLDYGMDIHIEDVRAMKPQPRLIVFDECFNGSFHVSPYIAGEYVLGNGKVIAGVANTTNALQDQWIDEFAGLLGYGVRFGMWHKTNNLLESHLFGDPTFHFASVSDYEINKLLVTRAKDLNIWKKMTENESVPLRSLGIYMMYKNLGAAYEKELINTYRTDQSFNVRLHALQYLATLNTPGFYEILKESISDPYELIRRVTAVWMGKSGREEYLPLMVKQLFQDESERVSYNLKSTMIFIDPQKAYDEAIKYIETLPNAVNKESMKKTALVHILNSKSWLFDELLPSVTSDTTKIKQKIKDLRTFRNYNFMQAVPPLINLAKKSGEDIKVRIAVLEALGWFVMAENRELIIKVCEEIISKSNEPEAVRKEALRTLNRVKAGYNNTITS